MNFIDLVRLIQITIFSLLSLIKPKNYIGLRSKIQIQKRNRVGILFQQESMKRQFKKQ